MCGQTFAVANTVPDLSTATRMSWPAAKVGLSVFGFSALASHTFTHEFLTGTAAPMLKADGRATRDTAGPWKAALASSRAENMTCAAFGGNRGAMRTTRARKRVRVGRESGFAREWR
jgi:hypothetical protein